jgi:ActR/RegA family two-component response regulator
LISSTGTETALPFWPRSRPRRSDQRAIVLTNYFTDATKIKSTGLGADAVFDKSTRLDDFFAYLRAGEQAAPGL